MKCNTSPPQGVEPSAVPHKPTTTTTNNNNNDNNDNNNNNNMAVARWVLVELVERHAQEEARAAVDLEAEALLNNK